MDSGQSMRYSELTSALLTRFPELFSGYAELKAMWDGDEPGPHIIYEDLLVPYIVGQLEKGIAPNSLAETFAFLEELATSEEQDVRDVLGGSVLEGLRQVPAIRTIAMQHMSPHTKKLAEAIDSAWR